ncbi:MAG: response regulator transcription factor [Flavobacteriales bacterium]|nr:response regulator transcription factor [Flavobacteriales bacterium]
MASAPLHIAFVDDHRLVREGLANTCSQWPLGKVVLQADDGLHYEKQLPEVGHIHVAIVDLHMPVRDGYDTIAWIVRHTPRTRALALSFSDDPLHVERALRAGACGYLLKNARTEEMFKAIVHAHEHGFYYNHLVDRQLRGRVDHDLATRHPHKRWASLTAMQHQVAVLYADPDNGTMADIAIRLGIAPATVEKHRQAVFEKLDIGSRPELVKLVLLNGLK